MRAVAYQMRGTFAGQRARLDAGLRAGGFVTLPSTATWFLSVDLAASGIMLDDESFADHAVRCVLHTGAPVISGAAS
mgnify:CR=1 FL=1